VTVMVMAKKASAAGGENQKWQHGWRS